MHCDKKSLYQARIPENTHYPRLKQIETTLMVFGCHQLKLKCNEYKSHHQFEAIDDTIGLSFLEYVRKNDLEPPM